jgi:hypothetical protein
MVLVPVGAHGVVVDQDYGILSLGQCMRLI